MLKLFSTRDEPQRLSVLQKRRSHWPKQVKEYMVRDGHTEFGVRLWQRLTHLAMMRPMHISPKVCAYSGKVMHASNPRARTPRGVRFTGGVGTLLPRASTSRKRRRSLSRVH